MRVAIWFAALLSYVVVLMVLATLVYLFVLYADFSAGLSEFLMSIAEFELPDLSSPYWWMYCGGPSVMVATSQFIFLVPAGIERPRQGVGSRSLTLSLVAAGIPAGLLLAGIVYAATDAAVLLIGSSDYDEMSVMQFPPPSPEEAGLGLWLMAILRFPWVLLPASWLVMSLLLLAYCRRHAGRGRWGRILGLLFGGTILELIIVVPVDIMVRRRTDCYCAAGTFHSLLFAALALVWVVGPGAFLALTSRRRRLWQETHCLWCGYPRGPSPGPVCPECGTEWDSEGGPE